MPDTPVEPRPDDPYHPALEFRVSRLESDVHDKWATMLRLEVIVTEIKATLDATLPHLATKAEVLGLRGAMKSELAELRSELRTGLADLAAGLVSVFIDNDPSYFRASGKIGLEVESTGGYYTRNIWLKRLN